LQALAGLAAQIGARLRERKHTIAVAESSAGGLINAALVAVPGASTFYLGGVIVYTPIGREKLLGITREEMKGIRSASEPFARLMAARLRANLGATWAIAETGASGPTGNRYGDAAGHACIAVSGAVEAAITLETGSPEREANMQRFTLRALELLDSCLQKA
jgi:PncC family amidohydrolase